MCDRSAAFVNPLVAALAIAAFMTALYLYPVAPAEDDPYTPRLKIFLGLAQVPSSLIP